MDIYHVIFFILVRIFESLHIPAPWIVFRPDCRNYIAFSEDQTSVIAGIDLDDIVLIKTADAVLAYPVKSISKIKKLLASFADNPRFSKYL